MASYAPRMREVKDEAPTGKKEPGFSLQDLADQTGVEARTIRSYVERGLLPGPESLGRGARYPAEALDRLQVMQLLRDANRDLTLDQIRVLLQSLSPAQLADIASGRQRIAGVIDTDARTAGRGRGDALAYLQALRANAPRRRGRPQSAAEAATQVSARAAGPAAARADGEAAPAYGPNAQMSALADAARALAALAGAAPTARSVRAEAWLRIPVTPDIELSVRAVYGDEELAQLHRIGDALRQLLTRGTAR